MLFYYLSSQSGWQLSLFRVLSNGPVFFFPLLYLMLGQRYSSFSDSQTAQRRSRHKFPAIYNGSWPTDST